MEFLRLFILNRPMKFNIEKTTFDFLKDTGTDAMLPVIRRANEFDKNLPTDYQKWVLVRLDESMWQIVCRNHQSEVVFQQEREIESLTSEWVIEVILYIKSGVMKRIKQDRYKPILGLSVNAAGMFRLDTNLFVGDDSTFYFKSEDLVVIKEKCAVNVPNEYLTTVYKELIDQPISLLTFLKKSLEDTGLVEIVKC